jgi:hypothetical protein
MALPTLTHTWLVGGFNVCFVPCPGFNINFPGVWQVGHSHMLCPLMFHSFEFIPLRQLKCLIISSPPP